MYKYGATAHSGAATITASYLSISGYRTRRSNDRHGEAFEAVLHCSIVEEVPALDKWWPLHGLWRGSSILHGNGFCIFYFKFALRPSTTTDLPSLTNTAHNDIVVLFKYLYIKHNTRVVRR